MPNSPLKSENYEEEEKALFTSGRRRSPSRPPPPPPPPPCHGLLRERERESTTWEARGGSANDWRGRGREQGREGLEWRHRFEELSLSVLRTGLHILSALSMPHY